MLEKLKEQIKNFTYQRETSPASYIAALLKEYDDYDLIVKAFSELILSNDADTVAGTLSCFVYIMTEAHTIKGEQAGQFVNHVEENYSLFEQIKEKLYEKNIFNRLSAIKTLAFLGYEDCYDFLKEAFDFYITCDPLQLPWLIQGMITMSNEFPWDLVEKMVNHENYLFRWSFLLLLDLNAMDYKKSYEYLDKIIEDENLYLKKEAAYVKKKLQAEEVYEEAMRNRTQAAHGAKLDKEQPQVQFIGLSNMFHDYLTEVGQTGYELEELELFAQFYIDDIESIARKFQRFKERS